MAFPFLLSSVVEWVSKKIWTAIVAVMHEGPSGRDSMPSAGHVPQNAGYVGYLLSPDGAGIQPLRVAHERSEGIPRQTVQR